MGQLGETIGHVENDLMTLGGEGGGDEVHSNMQPQLLRNSQGLEESWRSLMGCLPLEHMGQAAMHSLVSWAMEGHPNRCRRKYNERLIPGWQVNLEEWDQCSTSEHIANGMNNQSRGPSPRSGADCWASWTVFSTCQDAAPRMQERGNMGSRSVSPGSEVNWWDRASGFRLCEPGW